MYLTEAQQRVYQDQGFLFAVKEPRPEFLVSRDTTAVEPLSVSEQPLHNK